MSLSKLARQVCAVVHLEDELNRHMRDFGVDEVLTLSDVTRTIRKDPELLNAIRDFNKKMFDERGGSKI